MKKFLDNSAIFIVSYIIFMLPTYFLPYLRNNASAVEAGFSNDLNWSFLIYLFSMIVLCSICWIRGGIIGKQWLVVLPIIAFAFEFISKLSVVPYVPTMYHGLAIVVGAASTTILVPKRLSN